MSQFLSLLFISNFKANFKVWFTKAGNLHCGKEWLKHLVLKTTVVLFIVAFSLPLLFSLLSFPVLSCLHLLVIFLSSF